MDNEKQEDVLKKNLESTIEAFLEKNSRCGSKAGREDYWTDVSCKDIWDLEKPIELIKGKSEWITGNLHM